MRNLWFKEKPLVKGGTQEVRVTRALATLVVTLSACSDHNRPPAPAPAPSQAHTVSVPESYSVLQKDDNKTWCAYRNLKEFQADAEEINPTENASVTYSAGKLSEVTHVVAAESGDFIVIDTYTPRGGEVILLREYRLAEAEVVVIQEATMHEGKAGPFHLVTVATLDGKKTELPPNLDYPEVSPLYDLPAASFVRVVSELRSGTLAKLCRKME